MFNDLYGTAEGDRLLAALGAMITNVLPPDAVAARLRADHFVACVSVDRFDAYPVRFAFFFRIGVYDVEDPGLDVVLMSDRALIALREAKRSAGGMRVARYRSALRESLLREQEIVGEMDEAIATGQIELYFQPQYRCSTGEMDGAEVLARWNHPVKGLVGPDEFIPVLERNGLISRFDRHIWREACRTLRTWLDERPAQEVPSPSVNLSRADLDCPDLGSCLQGLVEEHGLRTSSLHLEITESAYMEAPERLVGAVEELRGRGFAVHMDDFGTGYSSLNTLKDVPVRLLDAGLAPLPTAASR